MKAGSRYAICYIDKDQDRSFGGTGVFTGIVEKWPVDDRTEDLYKFERCATTDGKLLDDSDHWYFPLEAIVAEIS